MVNYVHVHGSDRNIHQGNGLRKYCASIFWKICFLGNVASYREGRTCTSQWKTQQHESTRHEYVLLVGYVCCWKDEGAEGKC